MDPTSIHPTSIQTPVSSERTFCPIVHKESDEIKSTSILGVKLLTHHILSHPIACSAFSVYNPTHWALGFSVQVMCLRFFINQVFSISCCLQNEAEPKGPVSWHFPISNLRCSIAKWQKARLISVWAGISRPAVWGLPCSTQRTVSERGGRFRPCVQELAGHLHAPPTLRGPPWRGHVEMVEPPAGQAEPPHGKNSPGESPQLRETQGEWERASQAAQW